MLAVDRFDGDGTLLLHRVDELLLPHRVQELKAKAVPFYGASSPLGFFSFLKEIKVTHR